MKQYRSFMALMPWLLALSVGLLLLGCQVAPEGSGPDIVQIVMYVAIGLCVLLVVGLFVQRSRMMAEMDRRVRDVEKKARDDVEIRIEETVKKGRQETEARVKEAKERTQAEARARFDEDLKKANKDAEKKLADREQQLARESEARLRELETRLRREAEAREQELRRRSQEEIALKIQETEHRVREDFLEQQRQRKEEAERKAREEAERRLQEAKRKAAQNKGRPEAPPPRPEPTRPPPLKVVPRMPPVAETREPAPPNRQEALRKVKDDLMRQAPEPLPASTTPKASMQAPPSLTAKGATILVAEDSVTMRKVFEMALAGEGCTLLLADTGQAALDMARNSRPSLVIADLSMSSPDGYELCRMLKGIPDLATTPVLLLHGSSSEYNASKALDAGAQGEISKPFSTAELLEKLQQFL